MPIVQMQNDEDRAVDRYDWPAKYVTPRDGVSDALRQWRKDAIKGQSDAAGYKEGSRHFLKLQRACTLMIPWFGDPDKNQKPERPIVWPVDLAPELDEISGRLVLGFG